MKTYFKCTGIFILFTWDSAMSLKCNDTRPLAHRTPAPPVNFKKIFFLFTVTLLIFALSTAAPGMLFCRDTGFKFLKNYPRKEYDSDAQNRWIIQDQRGIIYAANQNGLLEFDGVTWRSLEIGCTSPLKN